MGDWHSKASRLEQAGEFITIMRGAWTGKAFDFKGDHFHVEGASVQPPEPVPTIYYGGSSDGSMEFAARHVDVYLSYIERFDMIAERLERVRKMADRHGRELRCAVSCMVITRDTADEAWNAAHRMMAGVDGDAIRAAQQTFATRGVGGSVARQRLMEQLGGRFDDAVIGPNIWVGTMLVRQGSNPVLVGSHEEIADRLEEMHALGVSEFQINGFPNLEEYFRFGENVMPILRERGLLATA